MRHLIPRFRMPKHWNWSIHAPIKLTVNAIEFDWHPTDNKVMPEQALENDTPVKIQLVHYGTMKFRVTLFPVTKASMKN